MPTTQRQKATVELAQTSDNAVISLNSSNTRALAKLSSVYCPNFYHIEDEKQLAPVDISQYKNINYRRASTPKR